MVQQKELTNCIEDSFSRYAGSVILDRAICDARDMLKPAARMLIYSQLKVTKNIPSKPFVKSARVVGDCLGHYYTHGDASCYGTYMRMAKPFAMRYPLEECQGNSGTIITTGDEAASRYTELRLAKTSSNLYNALDKNTIDKWNINFDDTEEFPTVFPSIGFYNIVNGTTGIGVSISSSVPQFNIKEVNKAISILIFNPNASFDDIVCYPDFATGGILMNKDEVYESLKNGSGKACRLRAVMDYDPETNSIHITEMPFSVYTSTITEQLRELTEANETYGIEGIHDGSGQQVNYTIMLSKGVNPRKMMEKLFKDTSLEYWYGINMTMLDQGRYPKVFGWRDALLAHIAHSSDCLRKEFTYDLNQLLARQEIVSGLLKAIANIDDVVKIIRAAKTTSEASFNLKKRFEFTDNQIKAILDLKLQRLVNLEGIKLENEYKENQSRIEEFQKYLTDKNEFNIQLSKRYETTAAQYGDARRTKILNVVEDENNIANIPEEKLTAMILSNDTIRIIKTEDMSGAKRGRKGTNLKLPKDTTITATIATTNFGALYAVTRTGRIYGISLSELAAGDYSIYELIKISSDDKIVTVINGDNLEYYKYIMLATRNGLIKKTALDECKVGAKGTVIIKLHPNDYVVSAFLVKDSEEEIVVFSSSGYYNKYSHSLVSSTGRASCGIKSIMLKDGEYVVSALAMPHNNGKFLTIVNTGKGKFTEPDEFRTTSRGARGSICHKIGEGETLAAVSFIEAERASSINIICDNHLVTVTQSEIPTQARNTIGVKIITTNDNSVIHIV